MKEIYIRLSAECVYFVVAYIKCFFFYNSIAVRSSFIRVSLRHAFRIKYKWWIYFVCIYSKNTLRAKLPNAYVYVHIYKQFIHSNVRVQILTFKFFFFMYMCAGKSVKNLYWYFERFIRFFFFLYLLARQPSSILQMVCSRFYLRRIGI